MTKIIFQGRNVVGIEDSWQRQTYFAGEEVGPLHGAELATCYESCYLPGAKAKSFDCLVDHQPGWSDERMFRTYYDLASLRAADLVSYLRATSPLNQAQAFLSFYREDKARLRMLERQYPEVFASAKGLLAHIFISYDEEDDNGMPFKYYEASDDIVVVVFDMLGRISSQANYSGHGVFGIDPAELYELAATMFGGIYRELVFRLKKASDTAVETRLLIGIETDAGEPLASCGTPWIGMGWLGQGQATVPCVYEEDLEKMNKLFPQTTKGDWRACLQKATSSGFPLDDQQNKACRAMLFSLAMMDPKFSFFTSDMMPIWSTRDARVDSALYRLVPPGWSSVVADSLSRSFEWKVLPSDQ